MRRDGGTSSIIVAIVLIAAGLFLRWDLVDWLIDAFGMVFIAAGIFAGLLGVFKAMSGSKGHHARP